MNYEDVKDTLDPLQLLAVEVGEKIETIENEVVVVDKGRTVTMTKAGYESMERNAKGNTTRVPTKVLGLASFEKSGKVSKLVVTPFEGEKKGKKTKAAAEETAE